MNRPSSPKGEPPIFPLASSETEAVSTLLAATSHGSQGATADRMLVHVDTEQAHGQLVNSRLACVSVSRARYDAQIYTNDAQKLRQELVAAVSAFLIAGSSGKYAILRQGSGGSMIWDVRRGKAHSQEFADWSR